MSNRNQEDAIDRIESLFMFLGCARIPTDSMDGAIPLDVIGVSDEKKAIGFVEENPIKSGLASGWSIKAVHAEGDGCRLMTLKDIHWSAMSGLWSRATRLNNSLGVKSKHPEFDCYSTLWYSEIDSHGKFRKFPLKRRVDIPGSALKARRLFNPQIFFGYKDDCHLMLDCESPGLDEEIKAVKAQLMLVSLAVGMRHNWVARVKIEENIPSLSVITDAIGVRELWRLRDIPEGRQRRSALLHWVSEHWRQNRSDPEMEGFVRKHLRGCREFRHGSLHVSIKPSEVDEIDVEVARRDREVMKAKKADIRKRRSDLTRRKRGRGRHRHG